MDRGSLDCIGSYTKPRTEYGRMSRSVMMLMLHHVGGQLRVDNPAMRHNPERKPSDCKLPNPTVP